MGAWPIGPVVPELTAGEVHVWSASLADDPIGFPGLAALLDHEEQQRADRYRHLPSRQQFILARGLLRTLLGRYLNLAPALVRFTSGSQGKPMLASAAQGLHFNISHSHHLVLLAFTRCGPVGVDVEHVRPLATHLDMARRFFAPGEAAVVCGLPPDRSEEAFLHVWTRKEAFLKAVGQGISYGLERFEVSVPPDDPPRIQHIDGDPRAAAGWSLTALAPSPEYIGALAVEGQERRVRCWTWSSA